jgi:serine/threonine protein kinase
LSSPAEMLVNKEIAGWTVTKEMGTYPGMTGGTFSFGYIVEKDGRQAFLKAMDLQRAFPKGARAIQALINQYLFEKDILDFCKDRRLSGIIHMYEAGEFDVGLGGNASEIIYYLIFELADGDIRKELTVGGFKDNHWRMRVLHQSAVALVQLHGSEIAHQDLKPSNILSFSKIDRFKLADLGRCTSKKFVAPTSSMEYPGDPSYAPPEYHYNEVPRQHVDQRLGSDAYLLGSLISFLFANGAGALISTLNHLPKEYWPENWEGSYGEVLPFLEKAHTEAVLELRKLFPQEIRDELSNAYFNLCHPDPTVRGYPNSRRQAGRPLGLDRYRSIFDRLTYRIAIASKTDQQKVKNA